jgi:hypothetical protein
MELHIKALVNTKMKLLKNCKLMLLTIKYKM